MIERVHHLDVHAQADEVDARQDQDRADDVGEGVGDVELGGPAAGALVEGVLPTEDLCQTPRLRNAAARRPAM